MKKNTSTTARFTVLNNTEEVLSTNSKETAMKKIDELMVTKPPKIFLNDHKERKTSSWTKEQHQQNYRLQSAVYVDLENNYKTIESE